MKFINKDKHELNFRHNAGELDPIRGDWRAWDGVHPGPVASQSPGTYFIQFRVFEQANTEKLRWKPKTSELWGTPANHEVTVLS